MTDYKNLKLIATSNPHIRSNETTQTIMRDVIVAMLPALVFACVRFGARALALTAVSVVACVFWEWLYRKLMKKHQTVGDLSAVVTGMLLAFVSPVTMPYWMAVVGAFFAIIIVKQLFGHRQELCQPRSGWPCIPGRQLCRRYDHLDRSCRWQGSSDGFHR